MLDGAPILLVSHDADDDGWQFLDGNEVDLDAAVLISMTRAVDLDPSLREVADLLPGGYLAQRAERGTDNGAACGRAGAETAAD